MTINYFFSRVISSPHIIWVGFRLAIRFLSWLSFILNFPPPGNKEWTKCTYLLWYSCSCLCYNTYHTVFITFSIHPQIFLESLISKNLMGLPTELISKIKCIHISSWFSFLKALWLKLWFNLTVVKMILWKK